MPGSHVGLFLIVGEKMMIAEKKPLVDTTFLDMQAAVGVTKHPGGYTATNELLALCHIEEARRMRRPMTSSGPTNRCGIMMVTWRYYLIPMGMSWIATSTQTNRRSGRWSPTVNAC